MVAGVHDHCVGALEQRPQVTDDATDVVPHLHLRQRVDPVGGQLLADPRRVGVDDLPEQQLGADRQDVAAHYATRVGAAARGPRVAYQR